MKKILVIDDLMDNLIAIKESLEDLIPECLVYTAQSGKEGLKIAREKQTDVIITDIMVSGMNGYEICKKLKEDETTKHIPVIILTGSITDTKSRINCLEVGADVFLSKPIESGELTAQVNAMLRIKEIEDQLRTERELLNEKFKERTKELRESEKELNAIFNGVKNGIALLDKTGKVLRINKYLTDISGFTKKEIVGKRFGVLKMFTPNSIKKMLINFTLVLQDKELHPYEVEACTKKGEKKIVQIHNSLLKEKGKVEGIIVIMRDITEYKHAEKEIEKRQKYLESVLRHAPDAIVTTDEYNRISEWNQGAEQIFGYTVNEVLGKKIDDLITKPVIKSEAKSLTKKVLSGKKASHLETIRYRKDGSSVNVILSCSPISFGNQMRGAVAVYTDITTHKEAEMALKISEQKYRSLVETSSDWIWEINLKGKHIYSNNVCKKILRFSSNEICNMDAIELVHPEDQDMFRGTYKQAIHAKSGWNNIVLRWRDKDGNYLYLESSALPRFDLNKEIIGFIGMDRDITERKQAEETLKENEDRYRQIYQFSPDSIIIHDMDMNILDANNKAVEEFGYSKVELLKKKISDLHPKTELKHSAEVLASMKKKDMLNIETEFMRKDGSSFLAEATPCKYTLGSKSIIHVVIRDITDRKKAEEELKKKINALEIFNDASVDRELMINELRKEINELLKKIGKEPKYDIII